MQIPVSINSNAINDGTNYQSWFEYSRSLPSSIVQYVGRSKGRPIIGAKRLPAHRLPTLYVEILDVASYTTLLHQLYSWFDTEDPNSYAFVAEDEDGSNDRYVMVSSVDFQQVPHASGLVYAITLEVDGDAWWTSTTLTTETWEITGTGDTLTVTNGSAAAGNIETDPIITITPTSDKTSGSFNDNGRFVAIRWNSNNAASNYPYDIVNNALDTSALVSGGKMRSDGADIRVSVNNSEINYWLNGINTSTTKIWTSELSFQPKQEFTLSASRTSGSSDDLTVNEDISAMPSDGIIGIGTELFAYTGKTNSTKTFAGITPAAKGSTAASHSAGATVYWIQNEVVLSYGNSSATAPTMDDTKKPMFDLASSTNTSWVFTDFFDSSAARPGAWTFSNVSRTTSYGGDQDSAADPYEELGIKNSGATAGTFEGAWSIFNACGITGANFTNGHKYAAIGTSGWNGKIRSSVNGSVYNDEHDIAAPTNHTTWKTWSHNASSLASGSLYVYLWLGGSGGTNSGRVRNLEAADVTLTLNSSNTPTTDLKAEGGQYSLAATITNNARGEAITVTLPMDLDESVVIDTGEPSATYSKDGTDRYGAVRRVGDPRPCLLALDPGDNELQFDDVGTVGVTVTIQYRTRRRV